jgi:hypothetical protein
MFNSRRMLRGSRADSSAASSNHTVAATQPIHPDPTQPPDASGAPSGGWVFPAGSGSLTQTQNTILILVAWVLTLAWMIWLIVVAWRMPDSDASRTS